MAPSLVAARAAAVLAQHPIAPRYWIAYSGGLDSTALLHLCHTLHAGEDSLNFAAAHVHHGLHPSADTWAARAEECCRTLSFSLTILHVDARPEPGESPEAAARRARYAALGTLMDPGDVLLTAQHQDDQAETLLLQLLRGAGPAGLAAMPSWMAFGRGFLCRPLLDVPRRALHDYAVHNELRWIDDPGNVDRRFDRNYLHHEILPRLQQRWPGLTKTLQRSARHCAEADGLLTELGGELLSSVLVPERNTLLIEPLTLLSRPRQRLVLRQWLRTSGLRPLPAIIVERILREVLPAPGDRQPTVSWRQGTIRRHRGELYLLPPLPPFDPEISAAWRDDHILELPDGNGTLSARLESGPGIDPRHWRNANIVIRYRRGGETLLLQGRQGTRELKKLLQQSGIPPWIRERVPLIHIGDALAAVADLWVAADFEGDPAGTNVHVHWTQPEFSVAAPTGRLVVSDDMTDEDSKSFVR